MKNNIYIIEYNGAISKEGYYNLEDAMSRLKRQGYSHNCGWSYKDLDGNIALIYEIKLV